MNDVTAFDFHGATVRVVIVDGDPWWVAQDICDVLGYANARRTVELHCKGVPKRYTLPTAGGPQEYRVIAEPDLYRLVIGSNLPAAVEFERWVMEDVLPQIRKTGTFSIPQTYADALQLCADQARLIEDQDRNLLEAAPKVKFHDQVTGSADTVDMKDAAKILNMGMGRTKLFQFLREQGILMPGNTPYQTFIDRGYFRVVEVSYQTPDGETHVRSKTVVYQKGLAYIRKAIEKYEAGA